MKKIFAAIKKFVTKAIDKAKELWAKAKEWLNKGAQPTEVVGKLFKLAGIEK